MQKTRKSLPMNSIKKNYSFQKAIITSVGEIYNKVEIGMSPFTVKFLFLEVF